jgi:hypothetical protein
MTSTQTMTPTPSTTAGSTPPVTPTPTSTPTPTNTQTPTQTGTQTPTPTPTSNYVYVFQTCVPISPQTLKSMVIQTLPHSLLTVGQIIKDSSNICWEYLGRYNTNYAIPGNVIPSTFAGDKFSSITNVFSDCATCLPPVVPPLAVVKGADYILFTYTFTTASGTDLDTRTTLYVNNNTTTPYTNSQNPIGYCDSGSLGSGKWGGPNLWWGGDNRLSSGAESIYVDIKNIGLTTNVTSIEINCQATWLGTKLNGNVGIQMAAYSGGTIVSNGQFGFVPGPGAVLLQPPTIFPIVNVPNNGCANVSCVGLYKYTVLTGAFTKSDCR